MTKILKNILLSTAMTALLATAACESDIAARGNIPKPEKLAEVQLGATNRVGLVAPRDLAVTLPGGPTPELTLKVVYNGPIKAPIKAGQHIADLVVTSPGLPQQSLPLVAQSDVAEAGFFGRAWAGFWSLFGM